MICNAALWSGQRGVHFVRDDVGAVLVAVVGENDEATKRFKRGLYERKEGTERMRRNEGIHNNAWKGEMEVKGRMTLEQGW